MTNYAIDRITEAQNYAASLHSNQTRKSTGIPYITHLWTVAATVAEFGGTEEQFIAALLHDAAEDQGGEATLEDIRKRFGDDVAQMVAGCSDTFETPKPAWKQRKETYLSHLREASDSVVLISCCDKLHNSRSIVRDLRTVGNAVWDRFTGGRDGSLWYYKSLLRIYKDRMLPTPLVLELEQCVEEMHALADIETTDI